MDKLAAEEGMLFTNIYASGNRTVRGFEGVLSSFPPLPGDSIVKRDRSDNVETIARVLKRDGYASVFLYGGRGLFDGMRSFAVRNGYDRFVEQKHFAHPTFTTIWGVCDEDLFLRAVEEFRELAKTGQPFCGTVLSVSNHKPYTYPKGKIPEDPDQTAARERREILRLRPGPVLPGREEGSLLDEHHLCGGGRPRRAGLWRAKHSHSLVRNPAADRRPGGRQEPEPRLATRLLAGCADHRPRPAGASL